jgi:hypothetical protein
VFIDDDASGEGLSIYGLVGTASATPRSELSFPSRATSAVSRSKSSLASSQFTPFHTSRGRCLYTTPTSIVAVNSRMIPCAVEHLDDMVDDGVIDSFLIDFKRKSRVPFAASAIQAWWRMIRQRQAYKRYIIGKIMRCSVFKRLCFKAWHSITVAQSLCRTFFLNVSFRHWIKVVMDSRGWVNFGSEACNILSQRNTGLPGLALWNICINPSTWVAAQDEDRTLGDPLPVRSLVVALQVGFFIRGFIYFLTQFGAVFDIPQLKVHFHDLSALDENLQVGSRTTCPRKAETGAFTSHSIQGEISPQISNVGSMGFLLSLKAPSYSSACFYGAFAFLVSVD